MSTVDFLPFATGVGANVQTQSDYSSDAARVSGYASGTAISSHVNKVWRQSAFWGAVLANFVSNQLAIDVLDDGNVSGKITNFQNAVLQLTNVYAPLASPHLSGVPTAPTAAGGTNTTQIATCAFVAAALGGFAPINSPAFTGTPTAPTPTAGDNSTKIATTAFVTIALSGYAKLAGPAFTGVPTAPTAAGGTNTTQIATCAFVSAAITAGVVFAQVSDMQAASSTSLIVSPGRQHMHPAETKAWVAFSDNGSAVTTLASYRCSISRSSNGLYTVNFSGFNFTSANYGVGGNASTNTNDQTSLTIGPYALATGSCGIKCVGAAGSYVAATYGYVEFKGTTTA